jgi:Family of unknown function (DUF5691)
MEKASTPSAYWLIPATTYYKDIAMDAIVTAALIGTAHPQNIATSTGTPLDTLTEKLPSGETERNLLLSAGAWALYKQAGRIPDSQSQLPEPTAPETLPLCSAELATLLESMLEGEQQELLSEALACMHHAALRIPHELLPTALAVQGTELRSAMVHLIGERGRWLSQFNPAWSWVSNYLPGGEGNVYRESGERMSSAADIAMRVGKEWGAYVERSRHSDAGGEGT